MKITPPNPSLINQAYSNTTPASESQTQSSNPAKAPEKASGDSVNLSASKKDLQTVLAALDTQPPDRADYVAQLKDQVEQGTYSIDAEKIAGKMLGLIIDDIN